MIMRLLHGSSGEVRPVWKLGGFLGMVVAAFGFADVVAGLASAFLAPAALQWLFPLTLAALVVFATWICLRLEKRALADLGLQLTRRRLLEGGAGFAIGVVLFSGIALTQAAMVGIPWQLSRTDVAGAVATGLATMLISVAGRRRRGVVHIRQFQWADGRRGWILRLAVLPAHRRRGVATRLVADLEGRFQQLGCPRVNLLVMPDNDAGLRFWRARGYLPLPDVLCSKEM
jgi:ribosomal protein S18 acetylase RimI-like enzyme